MAGAFPITRKVSPTCCSACLCLPAQYVDHVGEVTRPDGTECTTFEQCRDLLDDGQPIDYQGMSGKIDLDDNGDPTSATFEVFHFGENGYEILEYVEFTND